MIKYALKAVYAALVVPIVYVGIALWDYREVPSWEEFCAGCRRLWEWVKDSGNGA